MAPRSTHRLIDYCTDYLWRFLFAASHCTPKLQARQRVYSKYAFLDEGEARFYMTFYTKEVRTDVAA